MIASGCRLLSPQQSQDATINVARPARRSCAPDTDATLLMLLYDTVGKPDSWTTFLDALAASYGDGMATLFTHDYSQPGSSVLAGTSGCTGYTASYTQHYSRINPWIVGVETRSVGLVTTTEAVLSHQELIKTEFYNDWCQPQGIGAGIGVTVQRDGHRMMAVSMLFPRAILKRDTEAVARLERLVPHLLGVTRLDRQLAALETRVLATEGALNAVATAMMVISAAGQIVYSNTAAEQIFAVNDGLIAKNKEIKIDTPVEEKYLKGLIAAASRACQTITAQPGGVMRISRPSGRIAYEVLVTPAPRAILTLGFSGSVAVVFVRDPEHRVSTRIEQLQRLYDLTGAEARLMQALLAGDTLNAVATKRGLSRETLRSQLKAVFLKTGTNSQLELLRLGLKGIVALQR